jgi:hypothetical protein
MIKLLLIFAWMFTGLGIFLALVGEREAAVASLLFSGFICIVGLLFLSTEG